MKEIFYSFVFLSLTALVLIFGGFAFVLWQINPSLWSTDQRLVMIALSGLSLTFLAYMAWRELPGAE